MCYEKDFQTSLSNSDIAYTESPLKACKQRNACYSYRDQQFQGISAALYVNKILRDILEMTKQRKTEEKKE